MALISSKKIRVDEEINELTNEAKKTEAHKKVKQNAIQLLLLQVMQINLESVFYLNEIKVKLAILQIFFIWEVKKLVWLVLNGY